MDNKKYSKYNGNLVNRSRLNPITRRVIHETRAAFSIAMLIVIGTLTACSASTNIATPTVAAPATSAPMATETSAPVIMATQPATAMPAATTMPAATSVSQQAAVNTALDPCQLISSQEASSLTGVTFGQGVESSTPGGMKICTYGASSTNIFTVDVVQAPDVATAQSDKAQFLADIQANLQQLTSQGLNITQIPDFADGAVSANVNVNAGNISLSGNAFGFLKGTVFFGFSDLALGGTAPTDAAMKAEATTVLGELP